MIVLNFILAAMIFVAFAVAVLWFLKRPVWMGFSGRTLWGWLTIGSVPVFLSVG